MKRTLTPGGEWLYFKLYTGIKSADRILAETILPLTESLTLSGDIDKWFFIRYADPGFHLRLRFCVAPGGSFDTILRAFHSAFDPLVEQGIVINILLDCYRREIERYGERSMALSEEFFHADSTAVAGIIARLREDGDKDLTRWLLALCLVEDTLTAAGYDGERCAEFIGSVDAMFRNEFGIESSRYTKPLNFKYRDNRKEIEQTMAHGGCREQYGDILSKRDERLEEIFENVRKCGGYSLERLLPSYTHMTLDRLFRNNNRQCEMAVYYLMNKYYTSHAARENLKPDEKVPVL